MNYHNGQVDKVFVFILFLGIKKQLFLEKSLSRNQILLFWNILDVKSSLELQNNPGFGEHDGTTTLIGHFSKFSNFPSSFHAEPNELSIWKLVYGGFERCRVRNEAKNYTMSDLVNWHIIYILSEIKMNSLFNIIARS